MIATDIARALAAVAGIGLVLWTLRSAIQTFILPRGVSDPTARLVFVSVRGIFDLRVAKAMAYERRDRIMALFAPIALVALTACWLLLMITGYTLIFWATGITPFSQAFIVSGSSLFTLGFAPVDSVGRNLIVFSEAGIGLLLAALLVAYLPTIYAAWSRREHLVATLEVRAGSPPSSWNLIRRYHAISGLETTDEMWTLWEDWFLDIEESHTSLPAIVFFRSPQPDRSWVNAAGVVLDSAALLSSCVDVPRNPRRELCLRAGYIALRRIADVFKIPYDPDPQPGGDVSISREEFDAVWDGLVEATVPMKPDRDQAWLDFSGWRVNYDSVLIRLAGTTMAPPAPWISDRDVYGYQHPVVRYLGRNRGDSNGTS